MATPWNNGALRRAPGPSVSVSGPPAPAEKLQPYVDEELANKVSIVCVHLYPLVSPFSV